MTSVCRKISSATTQHRDQALRPSGGAQGREHRSIDAHSADFAKTYYHPSPVHIMRKKPVSDGRVRIDLCTYHSIDEGQMEMLKAYGLIVNIV